jgi:hypothetical protein
MRSVGRKGERGKEKRGIDKEERKREPLPMSNTNINVLILSEKSGSHGGVYEDDNHLGLIVLMMEAIRTCETSV